MDIRPGAMPDETVSRGPKILQPSRTRSMKKIHVDFKFAAWSPDPGDWREEAPEAWGALQEALVEGSLQEALELVSCPRREMRTMEVRVVPKGETAEVTARCCHEWDDGEDLAAYLNADVQEVDAYLEARGLFLPSGSPGYWEEKKIRVRIPLDPHDFVGLIKKIDRLEEGVMANGDLAWEEMTLAFA